MTIKDFIMGMPEKTFDKDVKEKYEKAKKLLKESGGGAFMLIAIPNISKDEHEKWSLGETIDVANLAVYSCNSYTLSALNNLLAARVAEIVKDNPDVLLLDALSQFKGHMIIDEEDLKDES